MWCIVIVDTVSEAMIVDGHGETIREPWSHKLLPLAIAALRESSVENFRKTPHLHSFLNAQLRWVFPDHNVIVNESSIVS